MPSAQAKGELSASLPFSKLQLLSHSQAAVSQMYAVGHIGNQMTEREWISTSLLSKLKGKKKEPQSECSADYGSEVISLCLKDKTFNKDLGTNMHHPPGMLNYVCQPENCSWGSTVSPFS